MAGLKRFSLTNAIIDCDSLQQTLNIHAYLAAKPAPGQVELIPAAQTILVRFETASHTEHFLRTFTAPQTQNTAQHTTQTRIIETVYDGEDLTEVATLTGLSEQGVINAHTNAHWQVAFAGFAPGFFYLHAPNNPLNVPRRNSPRTRVLPGSLGLAGELSGVYPRTSPGGWQLIGRTSTPLWDLTQDPPALLEPGMRVTFKPVREVVQLAEPVAAHPVNKGNPWATVDTPGVQSLYQDNGRKNLTHWGVTPSGFADPDAAHEANRLVGNETGTTVIETLGGLKITAHKDAVLALTGASLEATVSSKNEAPRIAKTYEPFALKAGDTLQLGIPTQGLRAYLAVRGGYAADTAAGSTSHDTLAHLGAAPLASQDTLYRAGTARQAVAPPVTALALPNHEEVLELRILMGPRDDWFTADSTQRFTQVNWQVSDSTNRIGVRLLPLPENNSESSDTPILERKHPDELPSEGMVSGAIQVPPNGEPVVFLTDHPVTGGYPVIASIHPADLRLLAQAQPGQTIRFTTCNPDTSTPTNQKENRA